MLVVVINVVAVVVVVEVEVVDVVVVVVVVVVELTSGSKHSADSFPIDVNDHLFLTNTHALSAV